jgi:hypothetical protein
VNDEAKAHYDKWIRNRTLASRCRASLSSDGEEWAIVIAFYAAVHIVEGYLRSKDSRFWARDHVERVKKLREAPETRTVAALYGNLRDLSESVRYQPVFSPNEVDFTNANEWLTKIESILKARLAIAVGEDPKAVI